MRKSDRYELNLVEGSDIVNPLVQDVPNYERIDTELGKNADAGVPVATELLSGTVHALTRENPNAPMFRFVATSNYKAGDTFTVDGVQVTALLTSGEPLATGCYVINSNVLCCLVGTVLTMFCSNSLADVHAVDSDKLGGKGAEYYASANSVVEAVNLAQNSNQISLSNKKDIDELKENNTSSKWKLAGTVVGSTVLTLPDKYEELSITVRASYIHTWHIVASELSEVATPYITGFGVEADLANYVVLHVNKTTVSIFKIMEANVNYTNATLEVYYK